MHIKHSNQRALLPNKSFMVRGLWDQPIASVDGKPVYMNPDTVFKVVKYRRIIKP